MSDVGGPNAVSVVEGDLGCRGCGYNLRGLSREGRCPECDWEVRWSRLPEGFGFESWRGVRRTGLAIGFYAASVLFVALVHIGFVVLHWNYFPLYARWGRETFAFAAKIWGNSMDVGMALAAIATTIAVLQWQDQSDWKKLWGWVLIISSWGSFGLLELFVRLPVTEESTGLGPASRGAIIIGNAVLFAIQVPVFFTLVSVGLGRTRGRKVGILLALGLLGALVIGIDSYNTAVFIGWYSGAQYFSALFSPLETWGSIGFVDAMDTVARDNARRVAGILVLISLGLLWRRIRANSPRGENGRP